MDFNVKANIFNIGTNSPFEAFCPICGERALRMLSAQDGNINLDINCFVCCTDHNYHLNQNSFWQDEMFALPCGSVNLDICFVGNKEETENAMKTLNNSIDEIQKEFENEIAKDSGACMLSALNHLYDLARDGKIFCICNEGEVKIEAEKNGIGIICKACGTIEYIPVKDDKELKQFLARKSVVLISNTNISNRNISESRVKKTKQYYCDT